MNLLPIAALALVFVAMSSSSKKRDKKGGKKQPSWPQVPQYLNPGDPCDPLDTSSVPPGYGCFEGPDGFVVAPLNDPAAIVPLNYGEFTDEQGVREALLLLGFGGPALPQNVAAFQDYAYTIYDLKDGSLRSDGRLDARTIAYLSAAIDSFQSGMWIPMEYHMLQENLKDNEMENAYTIADAFSTDPTWEWDLPNGQTKEAKDGQKLSDWVANIVYWGTYGAGEADSPAPVQFSMPGTSGWTVEENYRKAWLRIHDYVKLAFEEGGVADVELGKSLPSTDAPATTFSGWVVDEEGQPWTNLGIWFYVGADRYEYKAERIYMGATDSNGRFSITLDKLPKGGIATKHTSTKPVLTIRVGEVVGGDSVHPQPSGQARIADFAYFDPTTLEFAPYVVLRYNDFTITAPDLIRVG